MCRMRGRGSGGSAGATADFGWGTSPAVPVGPPPTPTLMAMHQTGGVGCQTAGDRARMPWPRGGAGLGVVRSTVVGRRSGVFEWALAFKVGGRAPLFTPSPSLRAAL